MGNYRDLSQSLRGMTGVKILILDTNNIQFYYQHETVLPKSEIFAPYDLILIPGWVQNEYGHHEGKSEYIHAIPKPLFIMDETEDYLEMIGYSDERLLELFRLASTGFREALWFIHTCKKDHQILPDTWIDDFYDQGFETKQMPSGLTTKKNAGEVSIVTLCFLLLSHFSNHISSITLASSDYGTYHLKDKVLSEANLPLLHLGISQAPPISFQSTDVVIYNALKTGLIQPQQIYTLRNHTQQRSVLYLENFSDRDSAIHHHLVDIPTFISICSNHEKYKVVF
ncbi:hypothetical protein Back11_49440 [Paenibacillus baekrokdamisoli]|uniref:Uncharacterized protein n=1 Tax=Paenibacillus baekrokdamisoli TaxID=1712516 RepID=A0A3G9JKM7_9BACL|nr:hypothetical protein [Paenibacillus baekrokdamisoli]BBH23599.1 hypothetical protein Back11_49440 [Paenibacillus baekrokdamisoli]